MSPPQEDGDSLAEGIIGAAGYVPASRVERPFLPWHRPRKQFVRDMQWRLQIEAMIDASPRQTPTLRYLGLPGDDLLDLRFFHDRVCAPRGLAFHFLGFNTALAKVESQTAVNVSLDEVKRLPNVDPRSEVIADDFVKIASPDSIAWKRAFDVGPFDVLNLDLCNGFGQHEPGAFSDNHYNALAKLFSLQARQKAPWLLLLTTLAGKQHMHPAVRDKFVGRFAGNIADCPDFRAATAEKLAISDEQELQARSESEDGMLGIFVCALCKWIASMSIGQIPPSKVELKSVMGYRVQGGAGVEDLISIAVKFTPTFAPLADDDGLVNAPGQPLSECAVALQILNRYVARKNADKLLSDDPVLMAKMVDDSAQLLSLARYDEDKYRAWVTGA